MEEGRNGEPRSESWVTRRRDKAKMAWRHRSRNEKMMLRVIGFLSFTLLCFIITVTVMDIAYKAKIKDLENEIDALKTTPQAIASTSDLTDLTSDLTDPTSDLTDTTTTTTSTIIITTTPDPTTTTVATQPTTTTTTTPAATTTTKQPSTLITEEATATDNESTVTSPDGLIEALQSLLVNFSGRLNSKKIWQERSELEGVLTRTRATVAVLADIQREESKPHKKESHPIKTNTTRDDDIVDDIDIPPSVSPTEIPDHTSEPATEKSVIDYETSDTEDEDYWVAKTEHEFPTDDSSAPQEGSGAGATTP